MQCYGEAAFCWDWDVFWNDDLILCSEGISHVVAILLHALLGDTKEGCPVMVGTLPCWGPTTTMVHSNGELVTVAC